MKNYYAICVLAIVFSACQKMAEPKADLAAVTKEVNAFMEKNIQIFETNDTTSLNSIYADDAVILGTDPSEFWSKTQNIREWKKMIEAGFVFKHSDIKRDIRVSQDGNSAIVTEQYFVPDFSTKIQIRAVYLVKKVTDNWQIDYLSWALIPQNKDIEKLNTALQEAPL